MLHLATFLLKERFLKKKQKKVDGAPIFLYADEMRTFPCETRFIDEIQNASGAAFSLKRCFLRCYQICPKTSLWKELSIGAHA